MQLANFTSKYRGLLITKAYKKFLKPKEKVLDVGCGNGVVSKLLNETFKVQIIGCDIRNYLTENIQFEKMASPDKLPFPSQSFDTVMFNDVLHHTSFQNQESLLSEALRVGKKVLIFEVEPTLVGKIADFVLNKIHNRAMEIPFTFRHRTSWEGLARKLKVRNKTIAVEKPLLYPFAHIAFVWKRSS